MPDLGQIAPYLFGAFGLSALAALGKGLHWIVSIPQRRSLSTVETLKMLEKKKDDLHTNELKFKDQIIAERDRTIAELQEKIEVLGKPDSRKPE